MMLPTILDDIRFLRLAPPEGKVRMVLDTDTANEIDDQFALVYALLSPAKLQVEAIYAAPFHNSRSTGPADGMQKSHQEILRILTMLELPRDDFVFKGATTYLPNEKSPCQSDAVTDLITRALDSNDTPLYVVSIGAITNIASAILTEPKIIHRIVVVWLGGHALHWPDTKEFNLMQDLPASRLIFDCGVPLVHIPCAGVTTHLHTTVPEMKRHVGGKSAIGDYLMSIFAAYHDDHDAWSKVLWDIATIAYLINEQWIPTNIVHSPLLTDQLTWSFDRSRHFIRSAYMVYRDPIFRDLFEKLERHTSQIDE